MMWRDLVWGVVFFAVGCLLLAFTPLVDPEFFLVSGWLSLTLGVVLVCRFAMARMDDPLQEPWVDAHARWGDAHARSGVSGWRAGSGRS